MKMRAFWNIAPIDVSEVRASIIMVMNNSLLITLMMETVRTSETSVYYNETKRRYKPESSQLQKYSFLVK
jgi:hypothetical protein